jgi:two-component system, sensor histidine kinase
MSHAEIDGHAAPDDLETFFAVSLDMLCIRDDALRFVRVSPSWTDVLGWTEQELVGMEMLALIHPEDRPATQGRMALIHDVRQDGRIVGFVNRYRHKQGHYRNLEWRACRHGDKVYAVARDVTDRLAAERELREARDAAEAASRAKSDFLANMSHEVRTPLNGVIGLVDALSRTELSPVQQELLDLVRTSGENLERLVSDILDVSKIEAGRLELEIRPFDLAEMLNGPLQTSAVKASDKGLAFETAWGDAAVGAFAGDSLRIRQILSNLLSNAIKFTETGGVAVQIDIAEEAGGPILLLEVEDSGVGFSPEAARTLFDRFTQADGTITRRFGGTGLGLSICRSLAEMMGGTITAMSAPGVGSRFSVRIPLSHADLTPLATETVGPSLSGLRVLVAEDHPVNQKVVGLILEAQGCENEMVANGSEAVAAWRRGGWDLILMDMQMPEMDGLAATRAIRAFEGDGPRTPIIMLSANAMDSHRHEALAAGADLHVAKPVTAAGLAEAMARATASHL